jgi:hypothetical protein
MAAHPDQTVTVRPSDDGDAAGLRELAALRGDTGPSLPVTLAETGGTALAAPDPADGASVTRPALIGQGATGPALPGR